MRFALFLLVFCGGCVPFPLYQDLQKNLSASKAERNQLTKEIEKCEGQKRTLKSQRNVPSPAPAKQMTEQELDAVKKKAFDEAERQFRDRTKAP